MADDDFQLTDTDGITPPHIEVTEEMAALFPLFIEKRKLYLQEYTPDPVSREKPEAELALVDRINEGVAAWVFVGHGAFDQLTSEKVFFMSRTLPRFQNTGKYGLFYAASCEVGMFDNPYKESVCTRLLTEPDAGMTATIGASRRSVAGANRNLMSAFLRGACDTTATPPLSIGASLCLAKESSGDENSRLYNLFGDPASYIYPRFGTFSIDSVHRYDTLKALQRLNISGRVADAGVASVDGSVYVRLSSPDEVRKIDFETTGGPRSKNVTIPGTVLNSTISTLRNGRFSIDFVVPKSIPFGTSGARLAFFAWYNGRLAGKSLENIFFSADMPDSVDFDTVGPKITVYVNDGSSGSTAFSSAPAGESFSVNRRSLVTVMLDDPDGIRTNGSLVNDGLLYEFTGLFDRRRVASVNTVDGAPSKRYFTLSLETELAGMTADLSGQSYEFMVLAQDNYDNRTRKAFKVLFAGDSVPGLSSSEVFAYPNPFTDTTRFIWRTAAPSEVTVKIFTQSGRLIRLLKSPAVTGPYGPGANSLWDGRDEKGNLTARGVYLYSISFKAELTDAGSGSTSAGESTSFTGKMMKY